MAQALPGHQLPVFTSFGDPRTAYAAEATADGTGSQVTAIDPADGRIRWARRLPGTLAPAGTGASGALYLTATDPKLVNYTTAVVRYDPATGRTRRLPLAAPLQNTAAVVHGETVYLLAEGGALQAVGARKWDTETAVSRGSAPVVSGDRLFFTAADGRLLAVDTRSGGLLGQTRPQLAADRHNGFLQALPARVWTPRGTGSTRRRPTGRCSRPPRRTRPAGEGPAPRPRGRDRRTPRATPRAPW
ncbi:PQQ-binding-like beta-propeller repeat protein [Streptomyces lydicus]|nr:PQQ-binding-like beta-propeller repeat protein [Streptomyces lydicus]